MEAETTYESQIEQENDEQFRGFFQKNGEWSWPESVPEWAGGEDYREEFFSYLGEIWSQSSNPKQRIEAALHSGPQIWNRLVHDESELVRMAVALVGNDDVHMELITDNSREVRRNVAENCSVPVLRCMAEQEKDPEIARVIASRKDREAQNILIKTNWEQPESLKKIVRFLSRTQKDLLLTHEDSTVRVCVGESGNRSQANAVMQDKSIDDMLKIGVHFRLKMLQEITDALTPIPQSMKDRVPQRHEAVSL